MFQRKLTVKIGGLEEHFDKLDEREGSDDEEAKVLTVDDPNEPSTPIEFAVVKEEDIIIQKNDEEAIAQQVEYIAEITKEVSATGEAISLQAQ